MITDRIKKDYDSPGMEPLTFELDVDAPAGPTQYGDNLTNREWFLKELDRIPGSVINFITIDGEMN